jgi:hypothetical protein
MVYLVRYACHFGAQAGKGVYLLNHEQLIIRQGGLSGTASGHCVVTQVASRLKPVLGIAYLATLIILGCGLCICREAAVNARHDTLGS